MGCVATGQATKAQIQTEVWPKLLGSKKNFYVVRITFLLLAPRLARDPERLFQGRLTLYKTAREERE